MPKYHLFMSNTISKRLVLFTIMYILREKEINFYQEMDSEHRLQENGRDPTPLCITFVSDFLQNTQYLWPSKVFIQTLIII